MNVEDLYNRIDNIFIDYTTRQWKNGWQHEGDRLSKEFSIQKNIQWNNMFLLQKNHRFGSSFSLDGPNGFKLEVQDDVTNGIRIDIEYRSEGELNIYYYVDNELDWMCHQDFIVDVCQDIYDANVKIRQSISTVPNKIYGEINPKFAKKYLRDIKLSELGI